jgi:hypothetical protein
MDYSLVSRVSRIELSLRTAYLSLLKETFRFFNIRIILSIFLESLVYFALDHNLNSKDFIPLNSPVNRSIICYITLEFDVLNLYVVLMEMILLGICNKRLIKNN